MSTQASRDPEREPPPSPPAAAADPAVALRHLTTEDFHQAQQSDEFVHLRSTFRRFAFPMSIAFLVWYFGYVLMSSYAPGAMSTPVVGNLNVGLLWGLAQFLTTFVITALYVRHANRSIDPVAARLRTNLEEVAE